MRRRARNPLKIFLRNPRKKQRRITRETRAKRRRAEPACRIDFLMLVVGVGVVVVVVVVVLVVVIVIVIIIVIAIVIIIEIVVIIS